MRRQERQRFAPDFNSSALVFALMRLLLISLGLSLFVATAYAQPAAPAPSAQAAYVERAGLLEIDARCALLQPEVRVALRASAGQARRALVASGWSEAQLGELQQATVQAARARTCADPRNARSADQADASFHAWARLSNMDFPGAARSWSALRAPDSDGWLMRQTGQGGVLGVVANEGGPHLAFRLPLGAGQAAPAGAQIRMRDPARAAHAALVVPGRAVTGLEAGRPSPASAQYFLASGRTLKTDAEGVRAMFYAFPDATFEAMTALDPREAVEVLIEDGPRTRAFLFEVGDIAAARVFLALQAR